MIRLTLCVEPGMPAAEGHSYELLGKREYATETESELFRQVPEVFADYANFVLNQASADADGHAYVEASSSGWWGEAQFSFE